MLLESKQPTARIHQDSATRIHSPIASKSYLKAPSTQIPTIHSVVSTCANP
ncbi:hypothetical protein [uncultured Helicobacter sp.]|uniref:hypothetical protein n=1 Tax=uncultured Helicobacter sp. TaxID=175537 RepID=UPI00261CCC0E|nr:hypothetical protein [uncultured Helicobacter sp.]